MGDRIREGNYEKMGLVRKGDAAIFTFEGEKEDDCSILFYGKNFELTEKIKVPEHYCRGALRSVCIEGLPQKNLRYNYEINGVIKTDDYARNIVGREKWNDAKRAERNYLICGGDIPEEGFDWQEDVLPDIPRSRMMMYKLHVRNFSMDAGVRGKKRGTFAAVMDKIPYLKSLGVTTVEFMPVYEFEEMVLPKVSPLPDYLKWESKEVDKIKPQTAEPTGRVNCWGYVPGSYFAPKASYSSTPRADIEWKTLIRELHKNKMECVMELFFDEKVNQNIILDALRFWVREYHVDGFHLVGNSIPITAIAQDLLLRRTKLYYTGFAPVLLEDEKPYHHLYVYTDEYLYPSRKMLNHMGGELTEFLCQQRKQHKVQGFVNYIANHDGFTLADVFRYCEKHNEGNGEDNCDGNNWNYSNNCGVEGSSRKRFVEKMRKKQLKNAIAMLYTAQGVPLLYAGDEFGNSQNGNNNAYCQDNPVGWLNWKNEKQYGWLVSFVTQMAQFRQAHPVISSELPMQQNDYARKGFPDLSYHGENAWISAFSSDRQAVGVMYCGAYAKKSDGSEDDFVYIGYNFHSGRADLALPKLPEKKKWYLVANTALEEPFLEQQEKLDDQYLLTMEGQSVSLLIGREEK